MSSDWRNWCRLCGNCESTMKIEYTSEIEKIIQTLIEVCFVYRFYRISNYFNKNKLFKVPQEADLKVCSNCICTLNEIQCLVEKSKSLQTMFLELLDSEANFDTNFLNETRTKFGLKELSFVADNDDNMDLKDALLKQEIPIGEIDFDLDGNRNVNIKNKQ
jgi:hypothetical protein